MISSDEITAAFAEIVGDEQDELYISFDES